MPLYEYECEACHATITIQQPLDDHQPPFVCPSCNCEHTMKRVFTPSNVVYHAKGFYCTDQGNTKTHKE